MDKTRNVHHSMNAQVHSNIWWELMVDKFFFLQKKSEEKNIQFTILLHKYKDVNSKQKLNIKSLPSQTMHDDFQSIWNFNKKTNWHVKFMTASSDACLPICLSMFHFSSSAHFACTPKNARTFGNTCIISLLWFSSFFSSFFLSFG